MIPPGLLWPPLLSLALVRSLLANGAHYPAEVQTRRRGFSQLLIPHTPLPRGRAAPERNKKRLTVLFPGIASSAGLVATGRWMPSAPHLWCKAALLEEAWRCLHQARRTRLKLDRWNAVIIKCIPLDISAWSIIFGSFYVYRYLFLVIWCHLLILDWQHFQGVSEPCVLPGMGDGLPVTLTCDLKMNGWIYKWYIYWYVYYINWLVFTVLCTALYSAVSFCESAKCILSIIWDLKPEWPNGKAKACKNKCICKGWKDESRNVGVTNTLTFVPWYLSLGQSCDRAGLPGEFVPPFGIAWMYCMVFSTYSSLLLPTSQKHLSLVDWCFLRCPSRIWPALSLITLAVCSHNWLASYDRLTLLDYYLFRFSTFWAGQGAPKRLFGPKKQETHLSHRLWTDGSSDLQQPHKIRDQHQMVGMCISQDACGGIVKREGNVKY